MTARYSDIEIALLIAEQKPLSSDFHLRIQFRTKRGHKERELDVNGVNGSQFRLILRQSLLNSLDFSAILAYRPPDSSQLFRLRRYNGKSHEHTNTLEKVTFYDFHIHMATERYQDAGAREDAYAEPTDCFSDYSKAVEYLLNDCNFKLPSAFRPKFLEPEQMKLSFKEL
ncbi:MAG: hypothetical protein M0Z41_17785 [Peptococcaceae bacterium]|jgi:hypothetical protein|nr:hypothetical protein [Peptococcaceae bacterium]